MTIPLVALKPVQLRNRGLVPTDLDPIGAPLGEQQLANSAFDTFTLGAELISNGGFDTGDSWTTQGNWVIGSGVATHTGGSNDNLSQVDSIVAGHSYVSSIKCTAVSGYDGRVIFSQKTWHTDKDVTLTAGVTTTVYLAATGADIPSYFIRAKDGTGGTVSLDDVTCKEVTMNNWPVTGSLTSTAYVLFNDNADYVYFYSSSAAIGISQTIDMPAGRYYYILNLQSVLSGSIGIYGDVSGLLASFNSAGTHVGYIEWGVADTAFQIKTPATGTNSVIATSIELYPIVGG